MNPPVKTEIPFPLAGLEEYRPLTNGRVFNGKTSAASTQSAMNARGIDPVTGRARGSIRSGTDKFHASQVNGSEPIQEIVTVVNATVADEAFVGQIAAGIETDPAGASANGTLLITSAGTQQFSDSSWAKEDVIGHSCWDNNSNVYTVVLDDSANGFALFRKAGSNYVEAWETSVFSSSTSSATSQTYISLGIAVKSSVLNSDGSVATAGTVYVYLRTSGSNLYELWRFNAETGANLDSGSPWKHGNSGGITGLAQHSSGATFIDNCAAYSNGYVGLLEIIDNQNLYGRVIDASTGTSVQTLLLGPGSGTSSSYAINMVGDGTGNFFWSGYQRGNATTSVGKLTSGGVSTSTTGYYAVAYSPIARQLYTLNNSSQLVWLDDTLVSLRTPKTITSGTTGAWTNIYATATGGVIVSKNVSTRSAELRPVDNNGDPLSWASTTPTYQFNDIKYRYMAVNQYLPNAGDDLAYYRSATHLAVAGGTVKRIRNGSMSLVTGGTQALSREAPVIFSAQVDNRVYFVDGVTAKYYNATTNAMSSWTATGTGIPYDSSGGRPTLIAAWRRRILLAGLRQNANTVYATKQGDPGDLNTSPTTRTSQMAFAQVIPDSVNCLLPYNDDICLVGGDHSIHQFTGDPAAGGSLDTITNTVGIAYGRAFCQSADGTIFFLSSRGGVYRMVPSSIPQSVSGMLVNDRLSNFDLSAYIARMAWDDREQGFYLWLSPLDPLAASVHYFFDARNNAWWPISFSNVNMNGRVIYVIDGPDPDDRITAIGCLDGYIRKFNRSATTDDGAAINSYVYFGPLLNVGVNDLQLTLSDASGSVAISTHVGQSAEEALAASANWTGNFSGGRNHSQSPRRYGRAVYLKLSSTAYWAMERLSAAIATGTEGRERRS